MDGLIQANVIAFSGRAVEAAGDVDVLLLDKTGNDYTGYRQATALFPHKVSHLKHYRCRTNLVIITDETEAWTVYRHIGEE